MNIKKPLQPLSIMDWRGISNNDKPASHGSWLSICLQSLFLNKKTCRKEVTFYFPLLMLQVRH